MENDEKQELLTWWNEWVLLSVLSLWYSVGKYSLVSKMTQTQTRIMKGAIVYCLQQRRWELMQRQSVLKQLVNPWHQQISTSTIKNSYLLHWMHSVFILNILWLSTYRTLWSLVHKNTAACLSVHTTAYHTNSVSWDGGYSLLTTPGQPDWSSSATYSPPQHNYITSQMQPIPAL